MWTLLCWSGCIFLDLKHYRYILFAGGSWLSNLAKCRRDADKMQPCRSAPAVTMALLECPPPWNSMVPKASVGLSCVCLLIDHFSDRLSFLAKRSALSFWLDEMPGGRPTCWPIRRPQQHLQERRTITVLHIPIEGIMRNHRHKGSHGDTGKEKGRRERLSECESYVSSSEPRPRLKWQLVIWLSCPDWEERRRRICRPSKSFIGSVASQTSVFSFPLPSSPFSLPAASGFSRMTVACVLLYSRTNTRWFRCAGCSNMCFYPYRLEW